MCQPSFNTVDMEESFKRRQKISNNLAAVKFFSESDCQEMVLDLAQMQEKDIDSIKRLEGQLNSRNTDIK